MNRQRAITVALVALLGLVAALGVFDPLFDAGDVPAPARVALIILTMAAALWITEALPLFVTSLLILLLCLTWLRASLLAHDVVVARERFTAPFFSDVILLFLGGFVLAAGLRKYQLDEQMARWVMRRSHGSVPRLIAGIMAITAVLSMWLSNTATAAMMLSLCLPIVSNLREGDPHRQAIVLAVPFAANIGGLGTPIGSPPNAIAIEYLRNLDAAPSFARWMLANVPLAAVLLAIAWLLLTRMYRGDPTPPTLDAAPLSLAPTPARRLTLAVTLLTALGWLTTGFHGLSAGTVGLVPVVVLFGVGALSARDLRRLSWDVLLMMGGGLCLGAAIAVSGLADWLVARLPLEGASTYAVVLVFGVTACAMSSVMSNTATANLLMPIVIGLGAASVSPILLAVALACSLAMALPISTPPNAIAFSSGTLQARDLIVPGVTLTVIGLLLVGTVGLAWWRFVGLI
ncbi:MAG: SLC13 family permease [Acidobacteriota bacterium]